MPSLPYPYSLFYDFLDGAYVQHTNWNSKIQAIKHIVVTPDTLPAQWVYSWYQPPISPIFSPAPFYNRSCLIFC